MNLLKRLAVTALFRRKAQGLTKVNSLENVGLNHLHQVKTPTIFMKESRNFQCVGRRFYADLKKMKENPNGEVEEDMNLEDETDEIHEMDEAYETEETDESTEETDESTEEIFRELAAGNPEKLRQLQMLELEFGVLREKQCKVPSKMRKSQWLELSEIKSYSSRKRYLEFLRLNELKGLQRLQKAHRRKEVFKMFKEEQGFHYYGLSGHTMFMRVYEKDLTTLLNHRLLNPTLEVLLDCSYQKHMTPKNTNACAKQISYCFTTVRNHRCRASLKLCSFDKSDSLGKIINRYVPLAHEWFGETILEESYLDLYPKDKLVYLTPHTRTELRNLDPSLVYIIGAFVDKGTGEKVSLAKAKEHGLKMARLPINEYLLWKQGTKSLPLNLVLSILLDQAFYCDWYKSFKVLPTRCVNENLTN